MINRKSRFTFFAPGCILLISSSTQAFAACPPTATEPCFIRTIYTRHSANPDWLSNFDSPDPSGMAYMSSSDRLAVCDGEVDEMAIYNDANLFAMDRAGNLLDTSTTVVPSNNPYSNEPVGCAYNPANGHLYISDDDKNKVFDLAPGPDGIPVTGDDPLPTVMSTSSVCSNFNSGGSGDPEGLGYGFDPVTGRNTLFLFDGSNSEVYMVTSGRTDGIFDNTAICRRHFDTKSQGVITPDAGDYDPDNPGYLYIWGDEPDDRLNHFTTAGTKVRSFNISNVNPKRPAGVAAVPRSITGNYTHVYLADRGSDNDSSPNENDGKIYQFSIAALSSSDNQPPNVSAGPDQSIFLPASVNLNGTVTDDGLPDPPGAVTTTWSQTSGPSGGTATFGNAGAVDTTASFNVAGTYVLRLRANDGQYQSSDEVTITATPPLAFDRIYVSTASNNTVNGISFRDEDILVYNTTTGSWSMYFDGSDVGLGSTDIDAFHIMADNSILLSLRADASLTLAMVDNPMASGCTRAVAATVAVDNSDVLRFIPTSTGRNTAGCFTWFFDASNVGLASSSENVDAIGFSPTDGNLVVSTTGSFSVPGVSGADEDLLVFNETSLGHNTTSGTWALYFDGSDVGLGGNSSEDIDGTSIDGSSGNIYLTTIGDFSVPGLTGDGNDIFVCLAPSTGPSTGCSAYERIWNGNTNGLGSNNIDAFDIQ